MPHLLNVTTPLDVVQRVKQGFNLLTVGFDFGIPAAPAKCLELLGR